MRASALHYFPRPLAIALAVAASAGCGSSAERVTAPSQVRCTLQLEAETQSYSPAGGSGSVRVVTNRECTWSAQSDVGWLSLASPVSGQGEGAVRFTVQENRDPSPRTARVSVNDQRLEVSQGGRPCEFRLSSIHEAVDAAGGERVLDVEASSAQCPWTAAAQVPWVTITSGQAGSGRGTVRFRIAPADGPSRTGSLLVAGQVVTVVQGEGCSYEVEPSSHSTTGSGGPGTLRVHTSAGCAWSATSTADWVRITAGAQGTGPGAVEFVVAASEGPGRTAAIHVAGRVVSIQQGSGCSVSVEPSSLSAGADAVVLTLRVAAGAGCAWSAASNASWITIPGAAGGAGSGQVQVAVAANEGPARTGDVTVGGRQIPVAQASGCRYSVDPSTTDFAPGGGSGTVSVSTGPGCPWTAASNADWIDLGASSGTGPATLAFTVRPNSSEPRSGTLAVAGQSLTVQQRSPCSYTLLPPSHEFDANGGGGNIIIIVTGFCTWTAASETEWLRITSGATGAGTGLVQFVASSNAGPARRGTLRIAGQSYLVTQGAR